MSDETRDGLCTVASCALLCILTLLAFFAARGMS